MNHKWRESLTNINLVLSNTTLHQEIWIRKEDDSLELDLPEIINTDIGFQLMFGYRENYQSYVNKLKRNNNTYRVKVYKDVKDYKKYI